MRFILSDKKAILVDNKYRYKLNTRLHNASVFQLKKCSFQTDMVTPPLVVFLKSDALHALSGQKHTVELKAENHQDASNILAMLEETHTKGRYRLNGQPRRVPIKYSHNRDLDFYFTDHAGNNIVTNSSSESNIPTATTIGARSDLHMFLDFTNEDKLTLPTASTLTGIEAVNNSNMAFVTTGGTAVQYNDFGDGKCAHFSADWIRLTDAIVGNEPTSSTLMMLFKSQVSQDDYAILDFGRFKAYASLGQIYFDPTAAGAPGTSTDPRGGLPPPPTASFRPPPPSALSSATQASYSQINRLSAAQAQQAQSVESQEEADELDAKWGAEVQKVYDEFLDNERMYVTEGLWDRFPLNSRLFIGMCMTL